MQCPDDGNKARRAFCRQNYPAGFTAIVPIHQGIFVHDTRTGQTRAVATAPKDFDDFVYWNFSGMVPGTGESDDTGEPARWRSAAFVAVSGLVDGQLQDATAHTVFKARTGPIVNGTWMNPVDGIYLGQSPGRSPLRTVVESGMAGTLFDPAATYLDELTGEVRVLPVTAMGIERDGFRGNTLAVTISMGTEEAGWAGIYLATVVPLAD